MKISFDSLCLAAVVSEAERLEGGRLQKIVQLDDYSLALGIFQDSQENWLYVSCDPQFARAHLLTGKPEEIKPAPELCKQFRKRLKNGRIVFIRQRGLDRILEIGIAAADGDFQIVAELMGRHSNIMLVDSARTVLACARSVSPKQSKRVVQAGKKYIEPPFESKPSLLDASAADELRSYEGWSPTLQSLIDGGAQLTDVHQAITSGEWAPHSLQSVGAYPLPFPGAHPRESISVALQHHFESAVHLAKLKQIQTSVLTQLRRGLKARASALKGLELALDTASRASELQMHGELMLAYQYQIQPGDAELVTVDYDGAPITLKLNPEKTPIENAQRLFKKAKNAKRGAEEASEQKTRISAEFEALKEAIAAMETAESIEDAEAVKQDAKKRRWLLEQQVSGLKKEDRPYEGHPIRELTSPGGWKVLYGTNATSNDYLTTRVAKPADWWIHVRGGASSHVVIQTNGRPEKVPMADLIYAARISKKNSVMKHASYVPVDYTQKRYVRKPRKAAPGLVTITKEKVIYID